MQSNSQGNNQAEPDPHGIPPSAVYSEPWWRAIGYNPIPQTVTGENAINSSSQECPTGGSEPNGGQSLLNGRLDEADNNVTKDSQTTITSGSDGNHRQEHQNLQHPAPALPRSDDCLTQPPQLELVGHSIACASNPYQDPYYGGMMTAYGPQALVHPQLLGMHHARMPLPLDMTQEPVYVNAKQYHGILRRRQSRAKAELEKKLIKVRKPYLHESRHQHALRRARVSGGRFAKKVDDGDASNQKGPAMSSQSASSSGSEHVASDSAETWNSSNSQQEASQTYNSGQYHNIGGGSTYQSGEREEEGGECSGKKQWGSIASNQRPLAIQ